MKVELVGRKIPRNAVGDPCFTTLKTLDGTIPPEGVFDVFSGDEVVELVNRCVYQLEYQHNAHKVRAQRVRDREKPVKLMVKKLFGVPWSKATDEQVAKAVEALGKGGKP